MATSVCNNTQPTSITDDHTSSDDVASTIKSNTNKSFVFGGAWMVVAFLSFGLGIVTPSLVLSVVLHCKSAIRQVISFAPFLPRSIYIKAQLHGRGGCIPENLDNFLHDNSVPGLHIVCFDSRSNDKNTTDNNLLQITLFPGSQRNHTLVRSTPRELSWAKFLKVLSNDLELYHYNDFTKQTTNKWAIYTPNGDKIISAEQLDNSLSYSPRTYQMKRDALARMIHEGMVLLYQGGAFVWPGVRVGLERHVMLDSSTSVTLKTLSIQPLVLAVENFLTLEECDHVQTRALPHIHYSHVSLMDKDQGKAASEFRTSQSAFLPSQNDDIFQTIDRRVASITRLARNHQEQTQVLRYEFSEKYDAHCDYFNPWQYQTSKDVLESINNGERNRHATVFWYLTNVEEGGETYFPRAGGLPHPQNLVGCHETGLKVKPEKGKVIIFYNMLPDGNMDEYSLHAACPVKKGIKWAANKWVWNLPTPYAEEYE